MRPAQSIFLVSPRSRDCSRADPESVRRGLPSPVPRAEISYQLALRRFVVFSWPHLSCSRRLHWQERPPEVVPDGSGPSHDYAHSDCDVHTYDPDQSRSPWDRARRDYTAEQKTIVWKALRARSELHCPREFIRLLQGVARNQVNGFSNETVTRVHWGPSGLMARDP
jgi:hypothetical protein